MPSRQPEDAAGNANNVPLFARGLPPVAADPSARAAKAVPPHQNATTPPTRPAPPVQTATLLPPPASKRSRKMLPDVPSPWPRGHLREMGPVFAEVFVALAKLVSWLVAAIAQLVFRFFRFGAQGLGYVARKVSGNRVQTRGAEMVGWLLLLAILAGSFYAFGDARAWVVNRYFRPHYTRQVVPYVPPPAACVLPRAACAPPSEMLDGQPSLSATQILRVLQSYNSPAATPEFAAQLYDLGIKYGVNPAYALAFFVEESQCGTQGVAVDAHSLGNIRYTDSASPVTYGNDQGYRSYTSWRDGAEDWYWIIRTYYLNQGVRDVYAVTPIYAPSTDNNNPQLYAQTVSQLVQKWATT